MPSWFQLEATAIMTPTQQVLGLLAFSKPILHAHRALGLAQHSSNSRLDSFISDICDQGFKDTLVVIL